MTNSSRARTNINYLFVTHGKSIKLSYIILTTLQSRAVLSVATLPSISPWTGENLTHITFPPWPENCLLSRYERPGLLVPSLDSRSTSSSITIIFQSFISESLPHVASMYESLAQPELASRDPASSFIFLHQRGELFPNYVNYNRFNILSGGIARISSWRWERSKLGPALDKAVSQVFDVYSLLL